MILIDKFGQTMIDRIKMKYSLGRFRPLFIIKDFVIFVSLKIERDNLVLFI